MDLMEAVFAFDGKSVDDLRIAIQSNDAFDGTQLVAFCSSRDGLHRTAATWAVKALLEDGRGANLDLEGFFSCLRVETEWQPLLHLLQSVQFAAASAVSYREVVIGLIDHKKTLVAVWAMDALVRIAIETDHGKSEARARVDAALTDKKASMRARARHLAPLLGL